MPIFADENVHQPYLQYNVQYINGQIYWRSLNAKTRCHCLLDTYIHKSAIMQA